MSKTRAQQTWDHLNRSARLPVKVCDHKCHKGLGLNVWIASCPVCGCVNPKYDATVKPPTTWEELLAMSPK